MADNTVIVVAGRKGEGKSYLVREIVDDFPRVFIFDTMGEYDNAVQGKVAAIRAILDAERKQKFRIPLRILHQAEVLETLGVLFEFHDCCIVLEETSYYCSPYFLPDEIAQLVRYGRHKQISQIYVTRRPAEISRDLTAQADLIVTFRQHEPKDIEYLSKFMGRDAREAANLPKYAILAHGDMEKAPRAVLERIREHRPVKKQIDLLEEKG